MKKTGIVAIVGRPNVGKSSLFNRILGQRKSIVEDNPGATRDRLYANCTWLNQEFVLIDTGGITTKNTLFQKEIKLQVEIAISQADVIIFLCDGKDGLTTQDEMIAKILYKTNKSILLGINKIDGKDKIDAINGFWTLGLGNPYPLSSSHGIGLGDLLDEVINKLPRKDKSKDTLALKFSIIGRVNVGKSSLTNAILKEKRTIVSNIKGTTTDAIDIPFKKDNKDYVVIDTAGIRKKGKIYEKLEKYSVLRSIKAIDKSDISLLVVDAHQGIIEQDLHIAQIAYESKKGVIIVVNKWDGQVTKDSTIEKYRKDVKAWFKFMPYAPILFVSALEEKRITKIFNSLDLVYEAMNKHVKTSTFNEVLNEIVFEKEPSTFNGGQLNILYGSQVSTKPPTFVIFVNDQKFLHFSYKRYLENKLRKYFDFEGTPINLVFRNRKN